MFGPASGRFGDHNGRFLGGVGYMCGSLVWGGGGDGRGARWVLLALLLSYLSVSEITSFISSCEEERERGWKGGEGWGGEGCTVGPAGSLTIIRERQRDNKLHFVMRGRERGGVEGGGGVGMGGVHGGSCWLSYYHT